VHLVFTTLGYHPESTGGAFRYVTALAEGLATRGHSVEVIYEGTSAKNERRNGVTLHCFATQRGTFWQNWGSRNEAASEKLRAIRSQNADALIVSCHAYFARAVLKASGPIVSLFTGPWAEEFLQSNTWKGRPFAREKLIAPILRKMESGALRRSIVIVTISRYFEENLPKWHPDVRRPVRVVEGGVDLARFQPAENRDALRKRWGIENDGLVLLAIRRLEPRMGLSDLIDAFKKVSSDFPKAQLWIGGEGSERPGLEARIAGHPQVRMLGFVREIELAERYAAADCTIMPSLDLEGFGLATVESLACGTPVIGSRQGATPEILKPLDANLLYDSTNDLPAKLRTVLTNPSILPSREKCRQYAVERYSWEAPVRAFEFICWQIATGGGA
jgi:glycosyltransferase involved in cell wall biosynthesis